MKAMWLAAAIAAAIVVYVIAVGMRPDKLKGAIAEAKESGDVKPISEAIAAMPVSKQPTALNQAINTLWKGYERELAARLVHAAAEEHGKEDVIQYWIRHVLEVEPKIARKVFPRKFVTRFVKALQIQAGEAPDKANNAAGK